MSRITNKRTNKTQKWPRGWNGLGERSLSSEFHANRSINKEMAGVLVKMLKVHGQKAGLAAQWLVEIKSSLHEKEPDSREVFGRALNAVFSWLVALEIGWLTKKLEGLENIYYHITIDHSSSPMERSSSSSPKKVGQLPYGKEQFLPKDSGETRTLFTFSPKTVPRLFQK